MMEPKDAAKVYKVAKELNRTVVWLIAHMGSEPGYLMCVEAFFSREEALARQATIKVPTVIAIILVQGNPTNGPR